MNEEITLRLETFNDKEYILADDCIKTIGIHRKTNSRLHKEIKRLKEEYVMLQNASDKVEEEKDREIERLNNIINEFDKQNGEIGANLSLIEDRINKTNWWLENMLKQATNMETKAIISGTLELLLGSDKE